MSLSARRLATSIFTFTAILLGLPVFATDQEILELSEFGPTSLDKGPSPDFSREPMDSLHVQSDLRALTRLPPAPADLTPLATLTIPEPPGSEIALVNPGFSGFDGLTHVDQVLAGTGKYANTQLSKEPPDQALCVGNGFVLQAVNTALAAYLTDGTLVAGPTPLNQFFRLTPEFDRSTNISGDFATDPRCLFDSQTHRWFLTVTQLNLDPVTGNFAPGSSLRIAVSQTADPRGRWRLLAIDTTDHGTALGGVPPNCPCFGDQPLIGMDVFGFYISTNAFRLAGGFRGAQIYAMSKFHLAFGGRPAVVRLSDLSVPGGFPASIQPAIRLQGNVFRNLATEFLASIFDIRRDLQDKLVVWALTNTVTLLSPRPRLRLMNRVIESETYGIPADATQMPGPFPLGQRLGEREELLDTGDWRLQQVVYSQGKLWTSLSTAVRSPGGPRRAGVAWFKISAQNRGPIFRARVEEEGYLAVDDNFVFYPSVAVNRRGKGIICFSLSGPDFFPSAAYVELEDGETGEIHIAAAGAAPEDGFSGYVAFGGTGSARWGDYSAAALGSDGSLWFGNEYIPDAPRTLLANWGTFISRVDPFASAEDDSEGSEETETE